MNTLQGMPFGELQFNGPQVTFDFSQSYTFQGEITIQDFQTALGPIFSVSGISPSLVTIAQGNLDIDVTGLTFNANDDFSVTLGTTPLPAALPLFASGLGIIGLLTWLRRRTTRPQSGALLPV